MDVEQGGEHLFETDIWLGEEHFVGELSIEDAAWVDGELVVDAGGVLAAVVHDFDNLGARQNWAQVEAGGLRAECEDVDQVAKLAVVDLHEA